MKNATIRDTKPAKGNLVYVNVFGPGDTAKDEAVLEASRIRTDRIAAGLGGSVKLTERTVRADCVSISVYVITVREAPRNENGGPR